MHVGTRQILSLAWLAALVLGLIAQIVISWPPWTPGKLLGIIAFCTLIVRYLHDHWAWFYLCCQKCLLWVANVTMEWSLDVRLQLTDDESAEGTSASLEKLVVGKYGSSLERLDRRGPLDFSFHLARHFTVFMTVSHDGDSPVISIRISDMSVGFRESIRRIEHQLCPFFEHIEDQFHVRQDGRKYGLIAHFVDGNPYFGVFIQKLKVSRIDTFNLTIKTDDTGRTLTVTRDRVSLLAKSLQGFQTTVVGTFRLCTGLSQ